MELISNNKPTYLNPNLFSNVAYLVIIMQVRFRCIPTAGNYTNVRITYSIYLLRKKNILIKNV